MIASGSARWRHGMLCAPSPGRQFAYTEITTGRVPMIMVGSGASASWIAVASAA
jgi:predicted transcriptional regulator